MKRLTALLLCLLLCLGACGQTPAREEGLRLWFTADTSHWTSTTTALAYTEYQGMATVPALMEALLGGPSAGSGLYSPLPKGVKLEEWSVRNGVLTVELSREYSALVGVGLTLADYCITLTLTQLPGVEGVRINVPEGDLLYRDRRVLYAEDVVFSGAEEEPVALSAALYFQREGSGQLGYELRIFRLTESEQPALAVLEGLLDGPMDSGLVPLIPAEVKLYSARVDDGVCYADFSAALLEQVPPEEERQVLILSSIVETLCYLDAVDSVQILVEGEAVPRYGTVDLSQPLEPAGGGGRAIR